MLNGKPVDALALIVHESAQEQIGRAWVKKLRRLPLFYFHRLKAHRDYRQSDSTSNVRGPYSGCRR